MKELIGNLEDAYRDRISSYMLKTMREAIAAWRSHASAGGQSAANDDGEPGGTAGRPILAAIEAQDCDQVAVLVIRLKWRRSPVPSPACWASTRTWRRRWASTKSSRVMLCSVAIRA